MAIELPKGLSPLPKIECGKKIEIEEFDAAVAKAKADIAALTSGGLADSIGSLKSSIDSAAAKIKEKLDNNLIGKIPKIDLKLQDEFKNAINLFVSGNSTDAAASIKNISAKFPNFDIQKALNSAAGILPAGAIPSNSAELIEADLSKMNSNLKIALPKIQQLGGDISSGVTSLLETAQTAVGSAISSITSGSGTTDGLNSLASEAQAAVSDAAGELSKLGGAFSAKDGPISKVIDSLSDTASSLAENLTKGIAKIQEFDCCKDVPNQKIIEGVVVESATPPVKPTVDALREDPPTPAPKPATPVLVDKYSYPFWTKSIKDSFLDTIAPLVDGKRSPISNRIPLDRNSPAAFRAASKILDPALRAADEPLGSIPIEELERNTAMRKSLNAAITYLNDCGQFYYYRVENNLIDTLK